MSNLPCLEEFNVDDIRNIDRKWELYREEVSLFLQASGITSDAQKRAILLHTSGKRVREIFSTLENTGSTYDEACAALDSHFKPQKNLIYDRWVFRNTKQQKDETTSQFIVRLRKLVETCEYVKPDEEVRDQFVCGCYEKKLMEKLLRMPKLTIKEISETGSLYENSKQQAQEIASEGKFEINKLKTQQPNNQQKPPRRESGPVSCYNCGYPFVPNHKQQCPAKNKPCNFCGIVGHFQSVCRKQNSKKNIAVVKEKSETVESSEQIVCDKNIEDSSFRKENLFYRSVFSVANPKKNKNKSSPRFKVKVNNEPVVLMGDTGATCSCINYNTFLKIQKKKSKKLLKTESKIFTFGNKEHIKPLGKIVCHIEGNNNFIVETFYVMTNNFENILSKSACEMLGYIKIHGEENISKVVSKQNFPAESKSNVQLLTNKYKSVFEGEGLLKDYEHKIYVDQSVKPVIQRLRRYPLQLKDKINNELDRLEKLDFIEKANGPSKWVSNMVVVPKKDGNIRLCLDARAVNTSIIRHTHPIPTLESIIDDLHGAKFFSKIDLRQAYCQIMLDEEARDLTTFVTEKGLMRYKRMIYGLTSASEDFQKIIENCFAGLEGVKCISDDTIVYSRTLEEHLQRLENLLQRAKELGLKFNLPKCQFLTKEISFFGVIIGENGVKMDESKVSTLNSFRSPTNASELKSFLGFATFCSRFVPNFSTLTGPLRELLKDNNPFKWTLKHQHAFDNIKDIITKNICLSFYDPAAKCKLVTDASDHGLGAVLLQTVNNVDKPIAFASRSLTKLESKYTTTEKECLAFVFAVQKFHNYLYGVEFDVHVDHKPLESLNNCNKKPNARIERWLMTLQSYRFKISHTPGRDNIADCFSRLLAPTSEATTENDQYINFVTTNAVPHTMSLDLVRNESINDQELQAISNALSKNDWSSPDITPYKQFSHELTQNEGLILKGTQIVLPQSLRKCAINIAHRGHLGITKTVGLLRTKVFWPNLHKEVSDHLHSCLPCQAVTPAYKPEPLKPSDLPTAPWCEISADFHGPLPSGEKLLVILDEYSRFPIVHVMRNTTADSLINKLDGTFALFGYPDSLKTDNGPPFDSTRIKNYMKDNSIDHRKITPFHPQSNAKCERFMKVIGKTLKTAQIEGKSWRNELDKLLFSYRNSPHSSTSFSPALLFFNRNIKTGLPQLTTPISNDLHNKVRRKDANSQEKMKDNFTNRFHPKDSNITVGDKILIKQSKKNQLSSFYKPQPFTVTSKKGSMITITDSNGSSYARDLSEAKKFNEPKEKSVDFKENIHSSLPDKTVDFRKHKTELKIYPKRERNPVLRYEANH